MDSTGGGFMDVTSPPMSGSQRGGGGGGDSKNKGVSHVNIAQIKNASDDESAAFQIDGADIGQVIVIGVVRECDRKSTKISYTIEDFTGLIKAVQWVSEEEDMGDGLGESSTTNQVREGMYVRCIGTVKPFAGQKQITSFKVEPITDYNEITYHILDTIRNHLCAKHGPLTAKAAPGGNLNEAAGNLNGGSNMGQYSASYTNANQSNNQGLDPVQQSIMNLVSMEQSDEGVSVHNLGASLQKYSESQIRSALEELSNEGHVYSTIDDDHFKSTDS
jgi:replication factor A2